MRPIWARAVEVSAGQGRFIWLPDQPVDHLAMFMTIHGAPLRRESEGANRWVLARGVIVAPDDVSSALLDITVDGRYRLWLNGAALGSGPVRSNPAYQRVDRRDISDVLQPGRNTVAVLIHVPGRDLAWYETVKGAWQPVFGDGGLHLEVRITAGEASSLARADETWRIRESDAWKREIALAGWGQDFIEDVDGRRLDPDWAQSDYDDRDWPHARFMFAEPGDEVRARGWAKVEPFPVLIPSGTSPLAEATVFPDQLHWVRGVEPRPDLPLKERLYAEELAAPSTDLSDGADALIGGVGAAAIRSSNARDTALLFSFDPYGVGRPFIEFDAVGGEVIEIAISEAVPGEFGRGIAGDGLRNEGKLWVSHICRYTARPGWQRFERFNATGIRAMQLVVRNAPEGIKVHKLGMVATHFPASFEGSFSCSDPLLTRLWEVGRHTLLMCAQDGWLDCPGRESRQWLGDGVVMFDMAAFAFGPSINPLHRQFLDQVCEGQRPDGLARMVSPGDIAVNSVTIPDYTLLWLIGSARYFRVTGDVEGIEAMMPSIEKALAWFERRRDGQGLIADVPEWHFIEWANVDRRGYSMPFNALYVGALKAVIQLAQASDRSRLAARCAKAAGQVTDALNRLHWNGERGVYVDSVDPWTGEQGRRVSQHANALALLFDVAPNGRVVQIREAITDRSRLKLTDAPPIMANSGPFDEEADIVRANSFFAHFVYDGIAKAGGLEWVVDEIRSLFGPMLATGTTTLWESFEPIASLCHGFSATPVYQLSRHCLGIEATSPGYASFAVDYCGSPLEWAKGDIPTPWGSISVSWRASRGHMIVEIDHPERCTLDRAGLSTWPILASAYSDGRAVITFGFG